MQKFIMKVFRSFCRPDYVDEIEGDLLERHHQECRNQGPSRANWILVFEVVRLFKPSIIKPLFTFTNTQNNRYAMMKNNVIISLRSFRRHRTSFLINLSGLSLGLTSAFLIFLWVSHTLSVDKFHQDIDQLYRMVSETHSPETLLNTSSKWVNEIVEDIPEIESVIHSSWGPVSSSLSTGEKYLPLTGEFATDEFFTFFTYPLQQGDMDDVLKRPGSVVVSETTAMTLFNSTDVVGETVDWSWYSFEESLTITGIFKDLPQNTSEQFDFVMSFDVFEKYFGERIERYNRNSRTFIKLRPGADPLIVNDKLKEAALSRNPEIERFQFLIPYGDFYLQSQYEGRDPVGGRIVQVKIFSGVGIIILLIACINFMNLSTARASLRLKEIGIKKTLGSTRRLLISQFFTESILLAIFSTLVALGLVLLMLPYMENLIGIAFALWENVHFWYFVGISTIGTGLLAGIYPAFYLSRFRPIQVLKSATVTTNDSWIRKGTVIFQYAASIVLIIAVMVTYRQLSYMLSMDLGYNEANIISFPTKGMGRETQQTFLKRVKDVRGVEYASGMTHALMGAQKSRADLEWPGMNEEESIWFEHGYVNFDMLEMLEVNMVVGRTYARDRGNEFQKIILNQTATKKMQLENPVGLKINMGGESYEIIGIMEDFHYQSLHNVIRPTILTLNEWNTRLALKIDGVDYANTLRNVSALYEEINPRYNWNYTTLALDNQANYKTEKDLGVLLRYFAMLAVVISGLGLYALASFMTEKRSKEMSIRKVLGASVNQILLLMSQYFLAILMISAAIAIPVAQWLTQDFLASFAYQAPPQYAILGIVVFGAIAFSILPVLAQAFKVASANLVDHLKDE